MKLAVPAGLNPDLVLVLPARTVLRQLPACVTGEALVRLLLVLCGVHVTTRMCSACTLCGMDSSAGHVSMNHCMPPPAPSLTCLTIPRLSSLSSPPSPLTHHLPVFNTGAHHGLEQVQLRAGQGGKGDQAQAEGGCVSHAACAGPVSWGWQGGTGQEREAV